MNSFCNDCPHRKIPTSIKEKFNKSAKAIFLECPIDDKLIRGCMIKKISIDWKEFIRFLKGSDLLTKKELAALSPEYKPEEESEGNGQ